MKVNCLHKNKKIWQSFFHANFNNVWASLPCCFPKGPFKRDFLGIDLTRFFWVRNIGNTSAMRVIFFQKYSIFKLDFQNAEKKSENVFCFRENCIWLHCVKLSLLRREYLLSALSVLGNSLEILHITKRDFLQINCLHRDHYFDNNVWGLLPCCFPKDSLKRDFLDIDASMFVESAISEMPELWQSYFFFWKCSKFKLDFKNGEKNSEKVFCFRYNCI